MKSRTRYSLAFLLAFLVAVCGGGVWLCGTGAGTATLLRIVSRLTPRGFETRRAEGTLLEGLHLTGVRVPLAEGEVSIREFRLDWRPLGLLLGRFQAKSIIVEGVRIRDDSPPSAQPGFEWPRVSLRAAGFLARIEELRVEDLIYRRLGDEPVAIDRFTAAAGWSLGVLSLDKMSVSSPEGSISGSATAGFLRRFLSCNLTLSPAVKAGPAVGPLAVAVDLEPESRVVLALKRLTVTRPGERGKGTASGALRFTAAGPEIDLKGLVEGLDLRRETGRTTDLSGRIAFVGGRSAYRGSFDLSNRGAGWRSGRLAADFAGDRDGVKLSSLRGALLGGTVTGDLSLSWKEGIAAAGSLAGRNLDPSRIDSRWKGVVNADLHGDASRGPGGVLRADVSGAILRSSFQGEPVSGELSAAVRGRDVTFRRLFLRGKGFAVDASGNLARGLAFSAKIADLSVLVPDAAGEVSADGRLRWSGSGFPSGSVTALAKSLAVRGARVSSAELSAATAGGGDPEVTARGKLQGVEFGYFAAASATVSFDGTRARHTISGHMAAQGAVVDLGLQGGYRGENRWEGRIVSLAGRDAKGAWRMAAPAALALSSNRIAVGELDIRGSEGEAFRLSGEIGRDPFRGRIGASFSRLLLARINPWLKGLRLDGTGSGRADLSLLPGDRFSLSGEAAAEGGITFSGKERIGFRKSLLRVDWGEKGLRGDAELVLAEGGSCSGMFSSSAPARPAFPESGKGEIRCDSVAAALLQPWLPKTVAVGGSVSGRMTASLLPGRRFEADGRTTLTGATISVEEGKGRVTTAVKTIDATWRWRGATLSGALTAEMAKWGRSRGEFSLPIRAGSPVSLDRNGALRLRLAGELRELGVLAAFLPATVREGHGELSYDLRIDGTPASPLASGSVRLANAGAYLPSAGITLSGVELHAVLAGDEISVDSFRAVSGSGRIEGTASLRLRDRHVVGYRATVRGDNFDTLHRPDLRASVSPRLEIEGTPERMTLSGEILVPELQISGESRRAAAQRSGDVVIVDEPPREPERHLAMAVNVGVRLGDHVTVKTRGLDARLTGRVDLSGDLASLTSRGEIKVVEGAYRAYGLNLRIARGRVFYAGGPLAEPTLDILALRTIGEVKAGVTVAGTVQAPVVKLYSEPSMPDVDILAYVVLGHPLGTGGTGEQAALVAQAAGALLSAGQSAAFQDQLRTRLGLSTLELQAAGEKGTGRMGYTPLVSTPGAAANGGTSNGGTLSETMLTVGKYLTPKIYVSYGRSIFTGANLFRLRYDISKRWQVETQTGNESGADLYYKIEFN